MFHYFSRVYVSIIYINYLWVCLKLGKLKKIYNNSKVTTMLLLPRIAKACIFIFVWIIYKCAKTNETLGEPPRRPASLACHCCILPIEMRSPHSSSTCAVHAPCHPPHPLPTMRNSSPWMRSIELQHCLLANSQLLVMSGSEMDNSGVIQ